VIEREKKGRQMEMAFEVRSSHCLGGQKRRVNEREKKHHQCER